MPKIPVSFKNSEQEIELYTEVISHSDRSAYIKEAIKFFRKYRHLQYELEKRSEKKENAY